MIFTDNRGGRNFAKDPAVVHFNGRYIMYYSTLQPSGVDSSLTIGIANSEDGENWNIVGEIPLTQECESKGIAAPGAIVLGNKVHLFYQTYGNGANDAICHAESQDGINFVKDNNNPIFKPTNDWCCGRAIDADVCVFNKKLFLYSATRDHSFSIQKVAGAYAPLSEDGTEFGKFQQLCNCSILHPELKWEQNCIEAPATIEYGGKMYMFYGGAYNCAPQQIGCAVSKDGRTFEKIFIDSPFIKKGEEGSWNSSESGHPFAFKDIDGKVWIYYQGSSDNGINWFLSRIQIDFDENGIPYLK